MKVSHAVPLAMLGPPVGIFCTRSDACAIDLAPSIHISSGTQVKVILAAVFSLCTSSVFAGGFTTPAVPASLDVLGSGGFMLAGAFGNPAGCLNSPNTLFVHPDHPQYKFLYALALTAVVNKQKIIGYVHTCVSVPWYRAAPDTFNAVTAGGTLAIAP